MARNKRNAIIMAAGTSSRFVPLSAEIPKGLMDVNGEVLIERQIRQLEDAGIRDITVVVGYMAEKFMYLTEKYGVSLVLNEDYNRFNNTSSLIRVLDRLRDTYICSSDNYFPHNVFIGDPQEGYYSALYSHGMTNEYCLSVNDGGEITSVTVGGKDSWYMVGHVYFDRAFSEKFKQILMSEYDKLETKLGYWEDVYIRFINELPRLRIYKYQDNEIYEFDTLDELREFDKSYVCDSRSHILKDIARRLDCSESELWNFKKAPDSTIPINFTFDRGKDKFLYQGTDQSILKLS